MMNDVEYYAVLVPAKDKVNAHIAFYARRLFPGKVGPELEAVGMSNFTGKEGEEVYRAMRSKSLHFQL